MRYQNELREEPRGPHWVKNFLVSLAVCQSFNLDVKAVQSIPPASSSPSNALSIQKLTALRIADQHERDSESLGKPSPHLEAFPKQPTIYSAPIPSSLFLSQATTYPDALCGWPR